MTTTKTAKDTIPTLTTDRLVLRPLENGDVPGFVTIWSDSEFTRYIGGRCDPDSVWHAMAGNIGCWVLTGVGPWAVVERSTGELVGRAGLWTEPGWPGIEAVWFIRRDRWGRGYAREAGTAAISWVFAERPHLAEVVSVILPENIASVRVAERLGMTRMRLEFLHGEDHAVYAITRSAWYDRLAGAVPHRPDVAPAEAAHSAH
jgi:RimJ/RimL family protein N-acetyltransferase